MSIARFRNRDDFGRPYWRTPSNVIPPTSSNVDDEPTTSSRRGRTLTLTPKALISRIAPRISSWSWLSGAMITRSTSRSVMTLDSERTSQRLAHAVVSAPV